MSEHIPPLDWDSIASASSYGPRLEWVAREYVAAYQTQQRARGIVEVPKRRLLELFMDYGEIKRQIGEQQGQIQYVRGYSDVLRRTHQHISDLEEQAREISVAIDAALAAPGEGETP